VEIGAGFVRMTPPRSPFVTVPSLFLAAPDSDLLTYLEEVHRRPRTPAYIVLFALMLRGYFGAGFKACDATTMMQESITLHVFFANLGMKMPGRSTLTELVNAVTNGTRLRVVTPDFLPETGPVIPQRTSVS
jgi:hypothetical protein